MARGWFSHIVGMLCCLCLAVAGHSAPSFIEASPGPDYRWALTLTASPAALAASSVRVLVDYQDDQNGYVCLLTGDQAQWLVLRGGESKPLGAQGKLRRRAGSDELALVVQRSESSLALYCNGLLAARAEGRDWPPGRCGWEVQGEGLNLVGGELQNREPVFLADDFMRTDEQLGGWQPLLGGWENNQQGSKVSRSANAFSFRSLGGEPCLAVAGNTYDTDYMVQAAVRSDNLGAVGLAVGVQDTNNYYLLRWTAAGGEGGGSCWLERVADGVTTRLTPRIEGGYQPGVWYKLQLAFSDDWVLGWIDEKPLFEVAAPSFGEGRIGLFSAPPAGEKKTDASAGALFDDVVQRHWPLFKTDFANPDAAAQWQVDAAAGSWAGPGSPPSPQAVSGAAWCGAESWSDPTMAVDLTYGGGAVGLALGRTSADGQLRAWLSPDAVRLEREGRAEPLASASVGLSPGRRHRVELAARGGAARLSIDGQELLVALIGGPLKGEAGLLAQEASGLEVHAVQVTFEPPFYALPPTLPAEFVSDHYMVSWAAPGAAWVADPDSHVQWHKGFYYGDRTVTLRLTGLGQMSGKGRLLLDASADQGTGGYELEIALKPGQQTIDLALWQNGQQLATASPAPDGDEAILTASLLGDGVLVAVDGQPVLSYPAERP